MDDEIPDSETPDLEPRAPVEADLVALCRRQNELGARYVVLTEFPVTVTGEIQKYKMREISAV